MKRIVTIFSVILVLLLSICSMHFNAATIYQYDGFSYTIEKGGAVICDWDNSSEQLIIPNSFGDVPVIGIDDMAFRNNKNITSVEFYQAFSLSDIGVMSFKGCSNLNGQLFIPSHITMVGMAAFQECTNIKEMNFTGNCSVIPAQLCYKCINLESVIIDDGVERIEKLAFANCSQLNFINIPSTVTDINPTAFDGDDNLVIYCYTDSYAHRFAQDNDIEYVLIDAPIPTEPETEVPTEEPATEPVTEAPTLPTEMSGYYLGDVDGNGLVETIDATYIQRSVAHMPYPVADEMMLHGDVDGDGRITIIDATYIMRYIVSIGTPYPIGEHVTVSGS